MKAGEEGKDENMEIDEQEEEKNNTGNSDPVFKTYENRSVTGQVSPIYHLISNIRFSKLYNIESWYVHFFWMKILWKYQRV